MADTHDPSTDDEAGLFDAPPRVPAQRGARHATTRPAQLMPTAAGGAGINDLDLVETVIGLAVEPGYVLIGAQEQVCRRRVHRGAEVLAAGADEALAVGQLLAAAVLTRGGSRLVEHRSGQTPAVSVLVPDTTRGMARRWASYRRPTNWGPGPTPPARNPR